jgi:predicted TIM-barrel fold metal-dependent hydrolase
MPDQQKFEFVDSHVHLWDLSAHRWYPALQSDEDEGDYDVGLGGTGGLKRNYRLSTYQADSAAYDVSRIVHVSATTAPRAYLDEIRWLDELAAGSGWPAAAIGAVEPTEPVATIAADLQAQAASPLFRGVRVLYGLDPASSTASDILNLLVDGGWMFDLATHPDDTPTWVGVLEGYPSLPVVLEHCGWPDSDDPAHFAVWKERLAALASLGNVSCKISGLAMTLHTVEAAHQRQWVEACVDTFGVERCLFGSNFPVDALYGTYDELLTSYRTITAGLSPADQHRLFVSNAERLYHL